MKYQTINNIVESLPLLKQISGSVILPNLSKLNLCLQETINQISDSSGQNDILTVNEMSLKIIQQRRLIEKYNKRLQFLNEQVEIIERNMTSLKINQKRIRTIGYRM
ncbi:Hypothetical_protein [Hexamita inflata]|uniref:Hypothetical_protein n=1 Tax=Hexamita inflata TaxID=28002 RepID=A0AA86P8E8_9EUKA|nr:Hypothetical protein HINF_LOCUS21305 [Hexamita inflata]CAI9933662.1 Hypothetical protein HINF_LOCUS21307 [Hexamita inflata]